MIKILPNSIAKPSVKQFRNFALAGTAAFMTTLAVSGCKSTKQQDTLQLPAQTIYEQAFCIAPYNTEKPNRPIIVEGGAAYRNTDGDIVIIEKTNEATLSLFKAIQEHSTELYPDIENTTDFFVSVEKNIPKNEGFTNLYGIRRTISFVQASNLFHKMYDLFTATDSDKGKTISVKEYTQMMEAWESTKPE